MITFEKPENYNKIIEFANKPRSTFRELREIRPTFELSGETLKQLLENCRFENCRVNEGYLKALGLKR